MKNIVLMTGINTLGMLLSKAPECAVLNTDAELARLRLLGLRGETSFYAIYDTSLVGLSGTQAPIQLKDPLYQVIIPLRAFGQYGVSVQHPELFMEKLMGTAHAYTTEDLIRYFRGLVGSRVTNELSTALTEEDISFVEASTRIAELSEQVARRLQDFFAAYGIRLINFFINSINAPENDPTVQRLKAVLSERQKMEALNYNYQQGPDLQHSGPGG